MKDKVKRNELISRVDEILYYLWDPIGISDEPCARSKYSSYALIIAKLVISEDVEKITIKLSEIESKQMGLPIYKAKNLKIAERLIKDNYAIEKG